MSDNEAISWSNYESSKNSIEQNVRNKISQKLLEHINFLEEAGSEHAYIQGMKRARIMVAHSDLDREPIPSFDEHDKLF